MNHTAERLICHFFDSQFRFKAEVLLWFSVAFFGVRVSVTFQFRFAHIIFSSVWIAELPSFRKELPTRLTICSLLYFQKRFSNAVSSFHRPCTCIVYTLCTGAHLATSIKNNHCHKK